MRVRTGGCLCGAVRYQIEGPMRPVIACHCRECRNHSGHYLAASQAVRSNVEIVGIDAVTWYRTSALGERGFCSRCGSPLFLDWDNSDRLSIVAGSLDQPSGLALIGHIYTSEQGDYYEIADGLPQREKGCDGDPTTDLSGSPEWEA
ncbi:GFA family protein [Rhodovibrio salinarum]|uniref:CENP-V/GFA domain-containing protein n=1 Tax=Rhodovibrio salinarum TaxID=1087 RepID=A0A934V0Y0_9PROT|nr:GFA family protein [Rhodovibrio salinarum]MBK1698096.1 hypothetical protein [Rhodovibrio salinarum]